MKDCLDFFETPTNQRGLRVEASVGRHGLPTVTRWKESSPIAAGIHGRGRQSQGRILNKIRELYSIAKMRLAGFATGCCGPEIKWY